MDDEPLRHADRSFADSGETQRVQALIRRLVQAQPYAVLCTQGKGQPYGSLVAFSATENLTSMVFATPKATRIWWTAIRIRIAGCFPAPVGRWWKVAGEM